MLIGVMLARFIGMVASMQHVAMGGVGVVTAFFMAAGVMMLGSLAVMSSCMVVMLCGLGMVLCTLMLASHGIPHCVDRRRQAQRPALALERGWIGLRPVP